MFDVERFDECIQRVRGEDHLGIVITDTTAQAHQRYRTLSEDTDAGGWGGTLAGLPMVVKDNIETAGTRTTSGSLFYGEHIPNADATVVKRLQQSGAVSLAKVNMHEFAFGIRSHSSVGGQCRNPWDPERVPGGSSGGSAAAVAAGLCVAALGTDTGGSVRLPAAMCGVSGLRPTVGRVPNTGTTPVCPSQDTVGPIARRVADVARVFEVIAGYDPQDPYSQQLELESFLPTLDAGVADIRIGIPRNYYFDDVDDSIGRLVHEAAQTLERQGARLVDVDVPRVDEMHHWASVVIYADACHFHRDRLRDEPEKFDPHVLERMRRGLVFTAVDYAQAMLERAQWRRSLARLFDNVDVLLSPTVHVPVPTIDDGKSLHQATRDATRNTYAGAFGQIPGLSVPCGFSDDGLPVGLQLEGAWYQEVTLLRVGQTYQNVTDWHLRTPVR